MKLSVKATVSILLRVAVTLLAVFCLFTLMGGPVRVLHQAQESYLGRPSHLP